MLLDGSAALPLRLADMDGEVFELEKAKGKWVFLHFWASWCGPCRKEMPKVQQIVSRYENSHLKIVLVNTAESEDAVFSFLASVAPDLNTLMDYDGLVSERWQPRGLPATFFIDPEGKLRYLALGGRNWDEKIFLEFLDSLSKK